MARTPTTPVKAQATSLGHAQAAEQAAKTIMRILTTGYDGDHVCECPQGNAAGITEAECGCQLHNAAKVLEAAGCYVRRQNDKGLLVP